MCDPPKETILNILTELRVPNKSGTSVPNAPTGTNVFFDTDTYTLSFKGATGTSDELKGGVGIRHYGPLAADPVTPTPKQEINTIIQ
jgi:hypothetical protein